MPHFHIQGESDVFDDAEHVEVQGEMTAYGFVTAERIDEKTVLLSEVALANLQSFEGILFQVEYEEEGEDGEESIVLRQVQMFFWPWDDDEEFADDEEADGDEPEVGRDGESNGSMA